MVILREKHPLPSHEDLLTLLKEMQVIFDTLHLNAVFHQLELAPESRANTTFSTHEGLYRNCHHKFSLMCASEIFQLSDEGFERVFICIDDILVYGITKNYNLKVKGH